MSGTISIKKIKKRNAQGELQVFYAVTAMSISTPQGPILIPNPSGKEASLFESLETAEEAVLRAGFDAEFEGKVTLAFSGKSARVSSVSIKSRLSPLEEAVPLLIQQLQDRESSVVAQAVFALGCLKPTQAAEPLLGILGHDDPVVRKNVCEALARLGDMVLTPLGQAYQEAMASSAKQAPYIRLTILNTFMEFLEQNPLAANYSQQWLTLAVQALTDSSWLVRAQAAALVGKTAQALELQRLQAQNRR